MKPSKSLGIRLTTGALVSALAALLMVAVGPSFAEKPDDAGTPQGVAKGHDDSASESSEAETDDAGAESSTEVSATSTDEDSTEVSAHGNGSKPDGPPGQTTPKGGDTDLAGGGAGNSENSTKERPDDASNGPGTGQEPASGCTNKHQGADPQQGGANKNPGPYDNTCDGRSSENGNGGGNATGRPCMGCVGNADDKNPKGQLPNGRDRNAGYECDRNNGLGKGNPAHTDCQGEVPECPDNDPDCGEPPCPPGHEKNGKCGEPDCPPGHVKNGKCDEEDLDCTGDTNPRNNDECDVDDERVCPSDSDRPGADIPSGEDMEDFCYDEVDSDRLCPAGTDLEGRPMPADGNCDVPESEVCPANSDFAGMPVPGRTMASCYLTTVLGDRETRPEVEGEVFGARPPAKVKGGALPFTGASVLAFLVLALQLIAAGTLILRGKRS